MKSILSILIIVSVFAFCLLGCTSNIPEEPAQTYSAQYTYINPLGATAANPENQTEKNGTTAVQYIETPVNVQLVLNDYYVFGNSVAKITNVDFDDFGIGNVNGYADVEIIAIGRRSDDMRIAYKAYDADGNVVRTSYIIAPLKDKSIKEGSVCEGRRFDFPREAVKVEFYSYVAAD